LVCLKARQRRWTDGHRDQENERLLKYYHDNIEAGRALRRRWAKENPAEALAARWRRIAAELQARPVWADDDAMRAFYAEARRLTEASGIPHHVDHIVPLRSARVCGLHCQSNLQVLPGSENQSKSNKHWPDDFGLT